MEILKSMYKWKLKSSFHLYMVFLADGCLYTVLISILRDGREVVLGSILGD